MNDSSKFKRLDELVNSGAIASYSLVNLDENLEEGRSKFCNSQKLTILFKNGESLTMRTSCSGVSENSELIFVP